MIWHESEYRTFTRYVVSGNGCQDLSKFYQIYTKPVTIVVNHSNNCKHKLFVSVNSGFLHQICIENRLTRFETIRFIEMLVSLFENSGFYGWRSTIWKSKSVNLVRRSMGVSKVIDSRPWNPAGVKFRQLINKLKWFFYRPNWIFSVIFKLWENYDFCCLTLGW